MTLATPTTRNGTDDDNNDRRTARVSTTVLLVGALVLAVSGIASAAIPDAATDITTQPIGRTAEPQAEAETAPDAEPRSSAAGTPLSFANGDRLTPAELAEFLAYVEAAKATGDHRGPAVYTSW